ncbi:MAG: NADH-quinone oxidoreductase subunit M [Thermoanaerobaculia bacterium]|nr:NADH-quinone oxidoreductase subunit M [Thermoanaerobaculia bacterium]
MQTFLELMTGGSLTLLVFFPVFACLPLLFFRGSGDQTPIKKYLLAVSLIHLALGIWILAPGYTGGGFEAIQDLGPDGQVIDWIPTFGIHYHLRADGISLPLVLLTLLLVPSVILGSWRGITRHWKGYGVAFLLLTTGMLGALLAFDLFLFYVFWEVMLVPMYLIIGIWGGARRIYAAVKFFLYTMAGSLPMLLGVFALGWTYRQASGEWSFALADLLRLDLPAEGQFWLFVAFALAFAIKVPVFPFHTWLPDAHVEAPTGGSVILAGVLLKLGTYGFLRFALPLFPHAARDLAVPLIVLALIGIVYGALVAWAQTDLKKLVAYSSVAHLGFVMLGLLAFDLLAWQGALIQMVNHGLSTGALFLLVGMLYDRRHTKKFDDFGGLAKSMPIYAFFLVFSALASVGLPALNGFVGEFLILAGTFKAELLDLRWAAAVGASGVILAAVYLLKMLYRTLWGPITREENRQVTDLGLREILALAPLCIFMLWIGVAPQPFLEPSRSALDRSLTRVQARLEEGPGDELALRPVVPAEAELASLGPSSNLEPGPDPDSKPTEASP